MTERNFIAIYFPYVNEQKEKETKNVSIPFNKDSEQELYKAAKKHSTTELKKMLAIFSYNQLVKTAEKEKRKVTSLIKLRLKEKLIDKGNKTNRTVEVEPKRIKRWINQIDEIDKQNKLKQLKHFLKNLI